MKFKFLNTVLAGLILSVSCLANASLILNITDAGAGNTKWVFSGETIATGSTNANGFWPEFSLDDVVNSTLNCVSIVSGSGSMFTTTSGNLGVLDACIYDNSGGFDYIALRGTPSFSWAIGDELSWSGDIILAANYSAFNPGSYGTKQSIYGSVDQFASPLIINIGPQNVLDVPEPSTLAIFVLGIMGLASRRFKKQS